MKLYVSSYGKGKKTFIFFKSKGLAYVHLISVSTTAIKSFTNHLTAKLSAIFLATNILVTKTLGYC